MTRVLLLIAGDNGTIGSCSLNLYNALKITANIEVKCAIINHFEDGYKGFSDASYYKGSKSVYSQIRWLKKIKKEYNPDITISTLFSVNTINVLSGGKDKKFGIFHSPYKQMKVFGKLYYLNMLLSYSFLYPFLDKLVSVSSETQDSLKSFPFIKESKKEIIYNAHNIESIIEKSKEPLDTPIETAIFEKTTILYCGRFDNNKAPIRAFDAFVRANLKEETQLVYLGNDPFGLWEEIEKKAIQLDIKDRIHYFGRKNNPYKYMKHSKALISCSYSESLPGVIIESLILGRPVITTNSSKGIWEIFSCVDKYDKNLKIMHETPCGIITSNLSTFDETKYEFDIDNIAIGLEKVEEYSAVEKFEFEEKIKPENIIEKFLNL